MTAEANIAVGYKGLDAMRHALNKCLSTQTIKVPMMPQVASKVMALTSDPNLDLSDLSDLVHRDPSLAARVLQAANSAAYRGSQEIGSLQEAVSRLGLSSLGEIILSASLRAGIFRVPGFEGEVNRLWRHALFSGYFGKEIARLKRRTVESSFLCGLLHAIGKPAVLQLIADLAKQYQFALKPEMLELLLEEFHWQISVSMAQQWNLPEAVQITCANYKNYSAAPACRDEAATTYLADLLASWVTQPAKIDELALKQDAVFNSLQFDSEGVDTVLASREAVEAQVTALDR